MSDSSAIAPPVAEPAPTAAKAVEPAGHELFLDWVRTNPLPASILGTLLVTLAYFYGAVPLFFVPASHTFTTLSQWIWSAWNPETHYEHGPLVPFIILFLIWNALPKLRAIPPVGSLWGLVPLAIGILFYLLSERTLQPRFAWGGLPLLLLGGILYAAGWPWARALLFPILCIFFLIPVPGIDQATVRLQVFATQAAKIVCNFMGLRMIADGVTLRAADDSFQFEVIGDCSGINSLMALTLMTAVFAHLAEDRLWKKLVLFATSIPVAIIGNIARLTSIMVVAKAFGQTVAGGWFHEISAYLVSFPFAFGTLCLVHKILNWNQPTKASRSTPNVEARGAKRALSEATGPVGKPISYDY